MNIKKILNKIWLCTKIYLYSMAQCFTALIWLLVATNILFTYEVNIPLISLQIAFCTVFVGNFFYYIKKGTDRFTK